MSSLSSYEHNFTKINDDRNTRTDLSAGWEGFYHLDSTSYPVRSPPSLSLSRERERERTGGTKHERLSMREQADWLGGCDPVQTCIRRLDTPGAGSPVTVNYQIVRSPKIVAEFPLMTSRQLWNIFGAV